VYWSLFRLFPVLNYLFSSCLTCASREIVRARLEELAEVHGRARPGRPRVLILAPTAELAQQVCIFYPDCMRIKQLSAWMHMHRFYICLGVSSRIFMSYGCLTTAHHWTLCKRKRRKGPQRLKHPLNAVLSHVFNAPCMQVHGVAQRLSGSVPFRSCCFTGGPGRTFKTQAKLLEVIDLHTTLPVPMQPWLAGVPQQQGMVATIAPIYRRVRTGCVCLIQPELMRTMVYQIVLGLAEICVGRHSLGGRRRAGGYPWTRCYSA